MLRISIAIAAFIALSLCANGAEKDLKPKIIYAFDPLCGWCFGFSPILKEMAEKHKEDFDFEILSGGMITGERIGPLGSFAEYIRNAIPRVESTTGIKFGEKYIRNILSDTSYIQNSVIPSTALAAFRGMKPDSVPAFVSALQSALYVEGLDLNEDATYTYLAGKFGLDPTAFLALMKSPETLAATEAEFDRVASYGINGFPSIVLEHKGERAVIARGFVDKASLDHYLVNFFNKQ